MDSWWQTIITLIAGGGIGSALGHIWRYYGTYLETLPCVGTEFRVSTTALENNTLLVTVHNVYTNPGRFRIYLSIVETRLEVYEIPRDLAPGTALNYGAPKEGRPPYIELDTRTLQIKPLSGKWKIEPHTESIGRANLTLRKGPLYLIAWHTKTIHTRWQQLMRRIIAVQDSKEDSWTREHVLDTAEVKAVMGNVPTKAK